MFLQKPTRFASTIKANGTVYFEDHFTATHKQIKVQCLPDHLTVERCSVYQYNLKNLLEHCPSKFYGKFYLKITLVNVLVRLHLFSMYISGLMDENKYWLKFVRYSSDDTIDLCFIKIEFYYQISELLFCHEPVPLNHGLST